MVLLAGVAADVDGSGGVIKLRLLSINCGRRVVEDVEGVDGPGTIRNLGMVSPVMVAAGVVVAVVVGGSGVGFSAM